MYDWWAGTVCSHENALCMTGGPVLSSHVNDLCMTGGLVLSVVMKTTYV